MSSAAISGTSEFPKTLNKYYDAPFKCDIFLGKKVELIEREQPSKSTICIKTTGWASAWQSIKNNTYVRDQFGQEYYTEVLSEVADRFFRGRSEGQSRCDWFCERVSLLGKGMWYIQVANLFKGLVGILSSAGWAVWHASWGTCCLAIGVLWLLLKFSGLNWTVEKCTGYDLAETLERFIFEVEKLVDEENVPATGKVNPLVAAFKNYGSIFKDAFSIFASAGHTVAVYVPFLLSLIGSAIPGVGNGTGAAVGIAVAFGVINALTHMTGLFDAMGNIGSFSIFTLEKLCAKDADKQIIDEQLDRIRKKLDPDSKRGFLTWAYMLNGIWGLITTLRPSLLLTHGLRGAGVPVPEIPETVEVAFYALITAGVLALASKIKQKIYPKVGNDAEQVAQAAS